MNGLIIINGYTKYLSSINQANRLVEEFKLLNVDVEIKKSTDIIYYYSNNKYIVDLPKYDFVIYLDKDKYLSRILFDNGYRLFNSPQSIEDCDDKMITHIKLSKHHIPMPNTIGAPLCYCESNDYSFLDKVIEQINFPIVVKECYGSKGEQIYLAKNKEQLINIENKLRYKPHLYQQFIYPGGEDYRLILIDHKVVAMMKRKNDNDFRSNIALGGEGIIVDLPKSFTDLAIQVSYILDLDYCGIDLLKDEFNNPLVCEVNSNAFFEGIEKATKVNVAKKYCEFIISKINNI